MNAEGRVDLSENVLHSDPFIDILFITSDCDKHTQQTDSLCKIRHSDMEFQGIPLMTLMPSLFTKLRGSRQTAEALSVTHPGSAAALCSSCFSAGL